MFRLLRKIFKGKDRGSYSEIEYSVPGTSAQNTEKLKRLVVEGNEWARSRTKENAEILGYLFSSFLMIEHKLCLLLNGFYPQIEECMFGQKIKVFKDFIKAVEDTCPYEFDAQHYRNMVAPLKQIKTLRDTLAHDITVVDPSSISINQVYSYVKKFRPDLASGYETFEDLNQRVVGALFAFTFIFSVDLGKLRMYLK